MPRIQKNCRHCHFSHSLLNVSFPWTFSSNNNVTSFFNFLSIWNWTCFLYFPVMLSIWGFSFRVCAVFKCLNVSSVIHNKGNEIFLWIVELFAVHSLARRSWKDVIIIFYGKENPVQNSTNGILLTLLYLLEPGNIVSSQIMLFN